MKLSLVKVTRKGQVTIPRTVREKLEISEGDYLLVSCEKDLIILKKISLPSWDQILAYGEKFSEKRRITRDQVLKAIREVRKRLR